MKSKATGVYIEQEGRQFGVEDRVRIIGPGNAELWTAKTTFVLTFPVFRARVWGLLHGYGWLRVGAPAASS